MFTNMFVPCPLRIFSRELTNNKLGITTRERTTLLAKAEGLPYARNLQNYGEKYAEFCDCCPNEHVKQYYNNN